MLKFRFSSKTYSSYFNKLDQRNIFLWNQLFKADSLQKINKDSTKKVINKSWGKKTPFLKVLIIRGIGYRGFITVNDLVGDGKDQAPATYYKKFLFSADLNDCLDYQDEVEMNYILWHDLTSAFFLTLRAGHTTDANWKIFAKIKNLKKNRKLVLCSKNKEYVNHLSNRAWQYRKPSVYTGRGIRRKGVRVTRKAGKRDQKGRGF